MEPSDAEGQAANPGGASGLEVRTAVAEADRLLCQAEEVLRGLQRAAAAAEAAAEERQARGQQLLAGLEALSQHLDALCGRSAPFRNDLAVALREDVSRSLRVRAVLEAVEAMEAPPPELAGRCADLCGTVDAQLEELGRGEAPSNSLTDVYDGDWSSVAEREVRVEVLSANNLAAPEYRFGDLTNGLLGGPGARWTNIYVEARVGQRVARTGTASAGPERRADFSGERMLFSYSAESVLVVSVRDKRGLQSAVRGDPLVGEGELPLRELPWSPEPQLREVALTRDKKETGVVSLRFQMLSLSGGLVVPHGLESPQRSGHPVEAALPAQTTGTEPAGRPHGVPSGDDFVTPPGSPREAEALTS